MVEVEVWFGSLSCCGGQPLFTLALLTDCRIAADIKWNQFFPKSVQCFLSHWLPLNPKAEYFHPQCLTVGTVFFPSSAAPFFSWSTFDDCEYRASLLPSSVHSTESWLHHAPPLQVLPVGPTAFRFADLPCESVLCLTDLVLTSTVTLYSYFCHSRLWKFQIGRDFTFLWPPLPCRQLFASFSVTQLLGWALCCGVLPQSLIRSGNVTSSLFLMTIILDLPYTFRQ